MDTSMMMTDMNRQDKPIPLQGLSLPRINIKKIKENLELPDQFLRACTLREGTIVVVLYMNSVALMLIAYLMTCLYVFHQDTTEWWEERFRDDFDYYYWDENEALRKRLVALWEPFAYAIIGTKTVYFITGCFVFYAIYKKTVHPCWYVPWMVVTFILVSIMWLMAFVMTIVMFILIFFRPITVTWDIGPIVCVGVYATGWTYCFCVVLAHYKRRCIVKYWRDRQRAMGTDFTLQGY